MPPQKSRSDHWRKQVKQTVEHAWKFAVFLATMLGIVAGWVAMVPKVSVVQNQPLDPTDPFSTPFVVSNDGPLPLIDVNFYCFLFRVTFDGSAVENLSTTAEGLKVPILAPGEKATVPCVFMFKFQTPMTSGDVTIWSSFRVGYTFFHKKSYARFVAYKAKDGNLYWYPQPATRN